MTIGCGKKGEKIEKIVFASFGTVTGTCAPGEFTSSLPLLAI